MKKMFFILSLMFFFTPSVSFAITSVKSDQTTTLHAKKKEDTPKKIKKSVFWLAVATGFLIGALISASSPVLAIVFYICCLVSIIVGVVYVVEGQ